MRPLFFYLLSHQRQTKYAKLLWIRLRAASGFRYGIMRVIPRIPRLLAAPILDVGRMLLRAKSKTPSGSWLELVERLPFGERTARCLLAIGSNQLVQDRHHGAVLPPSWRTIYELTQLSDEQFRGGLIAGISRPTT